ncbi:unnamed protein product [Closterium sp. NIES-53]
MRSLRTAQDCIGTVRRVENLVTHLRTSDARYHAALPAEFLNTNPPPMYITLYFIVTRLPDSLRAVRDHFLALDPTVLTIDLLEQHLLAAETSVVAVGVARGTPCTPFFEGCSPSPLAPSYASAAAVDVLGAEDVGAASASGKRRSSNRKGGRGGGGGSGGGGGGSSGGGGGKGGGGGGGSGGVSGVFGGDGGGSGGGGGSGSSGSGGGWAGATQRGEFGDKAECPCWAELLKSGVAILDLDYDAILAAMYALSASAEGDCYLCVLPDPSIEAAALGASESALPGTAPDEALHTFTLDSGASRCFFRDNTTLTPLSAPVPVRLADPSGGPVLARSSIVLPCPAVPSSSLSGLHLPSFSMNLVSTAALQDVMVTTTTPGGQCVSICTCTHMGRHLATFTRRPGLNLYTLATKPSQVAASAQVSASGPVAPPCSCRLLSHQTLLWHHHLGHPSLPRLRGMHTRLLVSGLPRSLPPLPPSPALPCLLCVEGQQRAAPHSSSFPPTTAPFQTLHMDVWGPARCRIGLVMEVAHTSMIHAAAPHFLWPFVVRYAAHQLNLWPRVSLPETSPTLRWTGEAGDALVFRHPTLRRVFPSQDVTFDESVPFYCLFPYRSAPPPPPSLFLAPGPPPGAESGGAAIVGAEPAGVEPGGAESEGVESGGAEPRGTPSSRGPAGALPWLGAAGAGDSGAGDTGAGGAAVTAGTGVTGGAAAAGLGGAHTRGTGAAGAGSVGGDGARGAGAGDPAEPKGAGAGGTAAGGAGAGGARAGDTGAVDAGAGGTGTGGVGVGGAGAGDTGAVDVDAGGAVSVGTSAGGTVQPQPLFVPLLCQFLSLPSRRVPRPCPPPVPGTQAMALRPSSVPLRVPLPAPPESSLPAIPDPESDLTRAASPTVSHVLAPIVTGPALGSTTASALVDAVPPFGANIIDGMWIFRVKRLLGSPPAFKARYVARGFSQRQGVDYVQNFSPTPKMTTLWVLPQVAAQRDYELHSLEFSTTFLQGSLHEEIWLRRPPGFTRSFPVGTHWSLRWPDYGLRQAPRKWHDTLMTTLAALGFTPSTADPSLFLRTDTTLPSFYVLVYVDDLVFATADTKAHALVKLELQKRHTCTDLGELRSYLGLQITRDRARCTITLTQSHMVHHVLQRFAFQFSSPQPTPLSTGHSLSARPLDESVEPSGLYPELVSCLMYMMTCTQPDLAYPLSLLTRYVAFGRHRKRSSQGYTFSLGSGSVSWRSTRSSSVLNSSCEAEIYAGAMAAQELRWLTYLLTDLGEQPRSPPVLYVDNKAMIALCQEHRLEHQTKHITLRYFLAQELQQRGQLRLAYVATRANTADIFTKALQPGDHQRFSTVLGLVPTLPH